MKLQDTSTLDIKIYLFITLIMTLMGCSEPTKYDIVIENAALFDGNEDRGIVSIAINNDTIAAISTEQLMGDSIVNGTGKYIIPGLVDAHVHISSMEDLKESYDRGILSLLNMHTGHEDRELEWKKIAKDTIGLSTLYGAGHAATVPGGHPNQFSPDMETLHDSISVEEWVAHRASKGADYIKIVRDSAEFMGQPPLPTLSYPQINKIIEHAHAMGFKAVVHTSRLEEMLKISEFKPDGFVHMISRKQDMPVSNAAYEKLAQTGVFIVPTGGIALKSMDLPPSMGEWIANNMVNEDESIQIIRKLHEFGIPIVAGTDAQEGQMGFGDDYFLELELYRRAGLSPSEILKTATGNAAEAFDLPIGELKVGTKANFLILDKNPLSDINNLKRVVQVWKNGRTIP